MRVIELLAAASLFGGTAAYGPITNEETKISTADRYIECVSEVSVDCTYTDNDGNLRSCIAEENNGPFLQIYEQDCQNQGVNGVIQATITLKMCNRNTDPTYIFRPNQKTKFKVDGQVVYDGFTDGYTLNPSAMDSNGEFGPIFPGECKTMIQRQQIDTCGAKKKFPMGVQMEGNMNTALNVGQSYCYAYVNRKNKIKRYPNSCIGNELCLAPDAPNAVIEETTGRCNSIARMTCEFTEGGVTKSCINQDEDATTPFYVTTKEKCVNKSIQARITMEMCNLNTNTAIAPKTDGGNKKRPWFKYDGSIVPEDGFQYFENFSRAGQSGDCKRISIQKELQTCRNRVPMSIKLIGNTTPQEQYCYTYLFRQMYMDKIVYPPLVGPSAPPVDTPTFPPAPRPTLPPAPRPTLPPAPRPTLPPTPPDAPPAIIITEIVDPADSTTANYADVPRFIECYVPQRDIWGTSVVPLDWKLVLYHGDNTEPDWATAVPIEYIPNDGVFVVCNSQNNHFNAYGSGTCDIAKPEMFDPRRADFGCDRAAIVKGDRNRYTVVDTFGQIGVTCDDTKHDFTGGRGVRLPDRLQPEPAWQYTSWEIVKPALPADPHVWPNDIVGPCDPRDARITEVSYPSGPNGENLRYVEIYFENCAGRRIKDDIKVKRYGTPDPSPVDLKDVEVPEDGFLIICVSKVFTSFTYGDICDIESPVAANTGREPVAVVEPVNNSDDIIDIYATPGSDTTPIDFKNGRAVRKKPSPQSSVYLPQQWYVYPGANDGQGGEVGPFGSDPRVWIKPIIITEMVDPEVPADAETPPDYSRVPRFIEMYVPNGELWNQPIEDDLKLVLIHGSNNEPDWGTAVPLQGVTVPRDGLIVVCNDKKVHEDAYGANLCEIAKPEMIDPRRADFGCDRAAIVHGDRSKYSIVDTFGLIGRNCTDSDSNFTDGRGVRLTRANVPDPVWNINNWRFFSGSPEAIGSDPHVWTDSFPEGPLILFITEIADPTESKNNLVELYSPNKRNYVIQDDLQLVIGFKSYFPLSSPSINLKGKTINDEGFIVFCLEGSNWSDAQCGYKSPATPAAGSIPSSIDGHNHVAIIKGDILPIVNAPVDIVDIYGRPNPYNENEQSFEDCRAVRKKFVVDPKSTWNAGDWTVVCDPSSFATPDPNVWIDVGPDQPSSPSSPSRAPSPTAGPPSSPTSPSRSKGKSGGKAKPKSKRRNVRRVRRA